MISVNEMIRDYINKKGIKQSAISKATGIKQNKLSLILLNKMELKLDDYCLICDYLGLDLNFFKPDFSKNENY